MKKELKIQGIKKIILAIMFIILTFLIFDYMLFKEFKFDVNLNNIFRNNHSYEHQILDSEFIYNNKMIQSKYEENTNSNVYTYILDLNEVPSELFSISLNFDSKKEKNEKIIVNVFAEGEIFIYDETNLYIDDEDKKTLLILHNNVYRITIMSEVELYDNEKLVNQEIFAVDSIEFNSYSDFPKIKKCLVLDFLKSVLISVAIFVIGFVVLKTDIDKKYLIKI